MKNLFPRLVDSTPRAIYPIGEMETIELYAYNAKAVYINRLESIIVEEVGKGTSYSIDDRLNSRKEPLIEAAVALENQLNKVEAICDELKALDYKRDSITDKWHRIEYQIAELEEQLAKTKEDFVEANEKYKACQQSFNEEKSKIDELRREVRDCAKQKYLNKT